MGKYLILGDWFLGTIAKFFINFIDHVSYSLAMVGYNIFYAVAQLDLFGGSPQGELLYNEITKRFYMILSIIMVFVFAYQLIMLIIDPDGKGKGASSQIVKSTVVSLVLLIFLPLIYRYMALFQIHVLENNTIGALILGTNASSADKNPGKNIAVMILISFYHPEGTTYSTFFSENGKLYNDAYDRCLADCKISDTDDTEHTKTCEKYVNDLKKWENTGRISAITWGSGDLKNYIGDTMSYSWILSTVAALAVAYVFFLYAVDIGARSVKLGVLQLISPIPVVLKIFPQTKKSFDTWFDQMKKTYLELFIRVAIIFFALELVKLVPVFISIIFRANGPVEADSFTKCVATLILVWGILRFVQDVPTLFKDLFSLDGNLLKGLELNPLKPQDRIKNNKAVMWGAGKATGAIAGAEAAYKRKTQGIDFNAKDANGKKPLGTARLGAIASSLKGAGAGLVHGKALTGLSSDDIHQSMYEVSDKVNKTLDKNFEKSKTEAYKRYTNELLDPNISNEVAKANYKDALKTARDKRKEDLEKERNKYRENHANRIARTDEELNANVKNANIIVDGASKIEGIAVDKKLEGDLKLMEQELRKLKLDPNADRGMISNYEAEIEKTKKEITKKKVDAINNTSAYQEYIKHMTGETEKAYKKIAEHQWDSDMIDTMNKYITAHASDFSVDGITNVSLGETDKLEKVMTKIFENTKNISGNIDSETINVLTQLGDSYGNYAAGAQAYADIEKAKLEKTNKSDSGSPTPPADGDKK